MPEPSDASEAKPVFIKGGIIVNHDFSVKADVLIQNGVVRAVGNLNPPDDAEVIDASDRFVLPGGVDLDCHIGESCMDDPVADTYASASKSAVLGGTTTIIPTVESAHLTSLLDTFDHFCSSTDGQMACDYGACLRVPCYSAQVKEQMELLVKEKGIGMFSFRLDYPQDSSDPESSDGLNDEALRQILRLCRQLGVLPVVPALAPNLLVKQLTDLIRYKHPNIGPELHDFNQPERAEADTIRRACLHAFHAGLVCPLLISRIHSASALNCFIEERRKSRGLLFGQTTISAIGAALSNSDLFPEVTEGPAFTKSRDWHIAAGYVCEPPLRPDVDLSERLLVGLTSNDSLTVSSGHRAISTAARAALGLNRSANIPKGVASIGCRLAVLWHCGVENNGGLDPCSFVRAVSTDPARLANLYPRKGRIAVGSDADIVIWSNPGAYEECKLDKFIPNDVPNIFAGLRIGSLPEVVMLRGHIVVRDGKICPGACACGKLLTVKPFSQLTFSRVPALEQSIAIDLKPITREPYTGKVAGSLPSADADQPKETHYHRKEYYDNVPKVALPPGQRRIHTSVKTVQPPGGSSNVFFSDE
ncbi:unnamed protein product [Calicophoron daubneyi]|uniref:dihydropyrimidinase n=1 Tax=Calicophoron daubneyi TaxID=300641 RepID=A0AAV2TJU7_CALDB